MSTFKQYTPEQLEKIERLREDAIKNRVVKTNTYYSYSNTIKATDRVFVRIDGVTIIGYVLSISKGLHEVSTPYGVMKDIKSDNLWLREYDDLSNVIIPEELKKETISNLLSELSCRRNYGDYIDYYRSNLSHFSCEQIRAELRTRPNIKSKKCARIVKKHSVK